MRNVISFVPGKNVATLPLEHYEDYETIIVLDIMQFTGLHDKNGAEIYEGDILEFDRGDGIFVRDSVAYIGGAFHPACQMDCYEFEVIGNIYETPELLKN